MVTDLLTLVPKPMAIAGAALVLGMSGMWGLETRYMTVADFTKSYILDLKREVRELRDDLKHTDDPDARRILNEQLESLLDELCLEVPDDPYCDR